MRVTQPKYQQWNKPAITSRIEGTKTDDAPRIQDLCNKAPLDGFSDYQYLVLEPPNLQGGTMATHVPTSEGSSLQPVPRL